MTKGLLSHFDVTNKSASAFVVAILGLLTIYKVIGPDAAAAWATLSMAVLSILIPKRPDGNQT